MVSFRPVPNHPKVFKVVKLRLFPVVVDPYIVVVSFCGHLSLPLSSCLTFFHYVKDNNFFYLCTKYLQ